MKKLIAVMFILTFSFSIFGQDLEDLGWHKPDEKWLSQRIEIQNVRLVEKHITGEIKDQTCEIQVISTFLNPNQYQVEGTYLFPLPHDASVNEFKMLMGDTEVKGELLDAKKAREIYESIVRKNHDPALLELVGYQLIRARVFPIPANQKATIKVKFTSIAKADSGLVKFTLPFTKSKVDKLSVDLKLESKSKLKTIYSPTHNVNIARKDAKTAKISFEEQNSVTDTSFSLYYSTSDGPIGMNVLTYREAPDDGFFVLMLSPGIPDDKSAVLPKDVVFVLDKSGSMKGKKIKQAKESLRYCVERLSEKDRFNIVDFQTSVYEFQKELVDASGKNIKDAAAYIDDIQDGGGTNISEALEKALAMLPKEEGRVAMVFFATDGLPTAGDRKIENIIKNTKDKNKAGARIFCFGVGYDVNTLLLDKIGSDNKGFAEYVKPEESIEEKVSLLYNKIQSPVLANVEIVFHGAKVMDIMPKVIPDVYKGMQLVIYGKYKESGKATIEITGTMGKEKKTFTFDISFAEDDITNHFIPRLWAAQKIAFLLDQITMSGKEEKELVEEIIELSKKYGIVTPYTSMLITEDNIGLKEKDLYNKLEEERKKLYSFKSESGKGDKELSESAQKFSEDMKKLQNKSPTDPDLNATKLKDCLKESEEKANRRGIKLVGIQHVFNKTFYNIKGVWTDEKYDEKNKDKIQKIKFESNEYYKLTEDTTLAKYLSAGEQVLVVYKGTIYQIEKEKVE